MGKISNLTIKEIIDQYWGIRQDICSKEEKIAFNAVDLSDYLEGAIIGRESFDPYDYIAALKKDVEMED